MSASILKALGLAETNSGTYLGNGEWSKTTDAGVLEVDSTGFVRRYPQLWDAVTEE